GVTDPAVRRDRIAGFVIEQVSRVLRIPVDQARSDVTFKDMGFDSLMAIELRNRLEAGLAVSLSSTLIWRYPDLGELVTYLSDLVSGAPQETSVAPPPAVRRGRWLVREQPRAGARLRLLCFPHGGA